MCQHQSRSLPEPDTDSSPSRGNQSCGCSAPILETLGQAVRWVEATTDMEFPAIPFPSARVFEVAGEFHLRHLVRRHHCLLQRSEIGHLFTQEEALVSPLVERIADYVVEACGGPDSYSKLNESYCMRTRHFQFFINETAREIWLATLYQAMQDTAFPETVRKEYWNWLEAFSVRMINRRTVKTQPERISYEVATSRFGGHVQPGLPCGVPQRRFCPKA